MNCRVCNKPVCKDDYDYQGRLCTSCYVDILEGKKNDYETRNI